MKLDLNSKIKLGIDAKWFFEGPPSGNMVVKNLVDEIIRNNRGRYDIYLLLTQKSKAQAIAHFPAGVNLIFLPNVPNLLSNMLIIPYVAWKHNIEVMLFQNFSSLWSLGLYTIAYIHDVLFLDHPQYYTKAELLYFKNMKYLAA